MRYKIASFVVCLGLLSTPLVSISSCNNPSSSTNQATEPGQSSQTSETTKSQYTGIIQHPSVNNTGTTTIIAPLIGERIIELSFVTEAMPMSGPYKTLLIGRDGLVYYETGEHRHLMPDVVGEKRQGHLSSQELDTLERLTQALPFAADGTYDATSRTIPIPTLYNYTFGYLNYFYGTQTGQFDNIMVNYDLLAADINSFSDIADAVKELFLELKSALVFVLLPPDAPLLISPANGSTEVSLTPTLRWNASPGASSYKLQVAAVGSNDLAFGVDDTTRTSIQIPGGRLLPNTTYRWWLFSKSPAGTSDPSTVFGFTTVIHP